MFSIVLSTLQRDNGTGVRGYDKTSSMLIFFSKDLQQILPNKSLKRHTATTFPCLDFNFQSPVSVANVAWYVSQIVIDLRHIPR